MILVHMTLTRERPNASGGEISQICNRMKHLMQDLCEGLQIPFKATRTINV